MDGRTIVRHVSELWVCRKVSDGLEALLPFWYLHVASHNTDSHYTSHFEFIFCVIEGSNIHTIDLQS